MLKASPILHSFAELASFAGISTMAAGLTAAHTKPSRSGHALPPRPAAQGQPSRKAAQKRHLPRATMAPPVAPPATPRPPAPPPKPAPASPPRKPPPRNQTGRSRHEVEAERQAAEAAALAAQDNLDGLPPPPKQPELTMHQKKRPPRRRPLAVR